MIILPGLLNFHWSIWKHRFWLKHKLGVNKGFLVKNFKKYCQQHRGTMDSGLNQINRLKVSLIMFLSYSKKFHCSLKLKFLNFVCSVWTLSSKLSSYFFLVSNYIWLCLYFYSYYPYYIFHTALFSCVKMPNDDLYLREVMVKMKQAWHSNSYWLSLSDLGQISSSYFWGDSASSSINENNNLFSKL